MELPKGSISSVRITRPLVAHLTNHVTINDCANICLCAGGSPVMCFDEEDMMQMASSSDAIVVNMGTFDDGFIRIAKRMRNGIGDATKPLVFDPVGAGADTRRGKVANDLTNALEPSIIKGNHSEIGFISDGVSSGRGVDSTVSDSDISDSVSKLARRMHCIVVSTGEKDYVSDGEETYELSNGTPMETSISGAGCMLSSVVAAYAGALGSNIDAVIDAVSAFNIAAENASSICKGPGTFKASLFDCLYVLDDSELNSRKKAKLL